MNLINNPYEVIYTSDCGQIIHGDNLDVMPDIPSSSVDSIVSDFPYNLSFMGRGWDNTENFYNWCHSRARYCYGLIKPGGYVAIFGHPKTNHRMKCAFEDAGFRIVEEVEWVYLSGMPKNQDIGKMFDREAGAHREVIGEKGLHGFATTRSDRNHGVYGKDHRTFAEANQLTAPATELAKLWDGWKTAGLKPAHEPITIFQKPLAGKYTTNIQAHGCGGMNIDACRVPISQDDIDMMNAKASKSPTTNYSNKPDHVYGKYALELANPANPRGRFPSNIVMDERITPLLDVQTGTTKSTGGSGAASSINRERRIYGSYQDQTNVDYHNDGLGGFGDVGGGSRIFTIIKYCPKVSPQERKLPDGERNPHVTLKPVELIKWLVKLLTPVDGITVDITAGTCTHAVACEELNRAAGYSLKWINIEKENTDSEPFCEIGKTRIENILGVCN